MLSHAMDESKERIIKQLLKDACILLGCRWNMDLQIMQLEGQWYAYGVNTRITVGDKTIKTALGDLTQHVEFIRSTSTTSANDLADYQRCRERWNVPESVTDSSSGWAQQERPGTSQGTKRPHF